VPKPALQKRVRRTQEERSAETRGRLLDATIDCLTDLGYAATTTTVIAERAGLSRGAQLHHFPTKAELVAAAVEHLTRRISDELFEEAAKLPADGDRVSAAVDLLWARFSTPMFPAWLELLVASRTDAELRVHLDEVERRLEAAIQGRTVEVFGGEASRAPGFQLALDLTLNLMYGMALEQALARAEGRARKRRDATMLEAWKRLIVGVLEEPPVKR
jgi:AcrR family transcriptional regulator